MKRTPTSHRFSEATKKRLKDLATTSGLSETQVLEALVAQAEALRIVAEWRARQPEPAAKK